MGVVEGGIDAEVAEFLGRQRLFFVATAPLAADLLDPQNAWIVGSPPGSAGLTKAPASTPAEVIGPVPNSLNWRPFRSIRQPLP